MKDFWINTNGYKKTSMYELLATSNNQIAKQFIYYTSVIIKKYNVKLCKKYNAVISNFEIKNYSQYDYFAFSLMFTFDNKFVLGGWQNEQTLKYNTNNILIPKYFYYRNNLLNCLNWWSLSFRIYLEDGSFEERKDYTSLSFYFNKNDLCNINNIFHKLRKVYYNIIISQRIKKYV